VTDDRELDRKSIEAVARNGDEAAFRRLYQRHTPRLYLVALRLVGGNEMDAEDVVQESWLRAVRTLTTFRWDAAFATWLIAIGINVARETLRKRSPAPDEDGLPERASPPVHHEGRLDLERAIGRLPAGYRTVLVLHDVEGWTHGAIGERLGISAGTSKSQLFAARRAMRALIDPPGGSYER
jgi:RNA polymerase sigma-70 factor (ECF subfamily)